MLSILVPCHNEAEVLPQLFARLQALAPEWDLDYEIILIDDGSGDATWELIRRFHREDPRWKGVRLARNFGQQAAIGAGLELAGGRAVVILDADLQDPPELIIDFLSLWRRGWDVVYGVRTERPEGWWKRVCYRGFYRLLQLWAPTAIPLDAGDFCLLDRRVVATLRRCREQRPFWRGLRAWVGYRQIGVPYARHSRQAGRSQYTFGRLVRLALDGFDSMTSAQTHLAFLAAGLAAVVLVVGVLAGNSWLLPSMTAALLAQLFSLSLMIRSQARLQDELRGRPRWVIAEQVGLAAVGRKRWPRVAA